MRTLITLAAILTLTFSGLLISGLNKYRNAIDAAQQTDGSDIQIVLAMRYNGFDLDVFDEPTTFDYIKSNFK